MAIVVTFIVGFLIGGVFGMVLTALIFAGRHDDE